MDAADPHSPEGSGRINEASLSREPGLHTWLVGALAIARYHGIDLDPTTFRLDPSTPVPSPAVLIEWVREQGMWAKAVRLKWQQLLRLESAGPVMLLMKDGGAVLMVEADAARNVVFVKEPTVSGTGVAVPVDELRLSQVWEGEVVMMRPQRNDEEQDIPLSFGFLTKLVMQERSILRSVAFASLIITFLTIIPILIVYSAVQRIIEYHSMSTLLLVTIILIVATLLDAIIEHARGNLLQVASTRIDAKIQLFVFKRLLSLPLDYFERTQSGVIGQAISKVYQIREFITGRLLNTFIDASMLLILLPLMFFMQATLAWTIVAAAGLIMLVIACFLRPLRIVTGRVSAAESRKFSVLVESLHGIKTVKSLALESARYSQWDEYVAQAGDLRLQAGRLALWPATLTLPLQRYCQFGVMLLGAYIAVTTQNKAEIGSLMAFTMISMRVAGPLIGFTKLMQDFEDVRATMGEAQMVLNTPPEVRGIDRGLRPTFAGAIEFDNVAFTYQGSQRPALNEVNFSVPPGTMLGLVGRSGSGKSTITRLLQGISRDYTGFVKIDGVELRSINLRHLRRNFGVVLQENFLFRGSIRDNIIGGRPGLTMEDVVRAARLAGAEEFIERMPQGYDTFIQEGSPNLSGGQRQRLAIARALIVDPRLMILDEATSALDPESEALVNANLKRIGSGRTMVIVSHRLASLVDCNAIIVMDQGKVLDVGTHAELVERCSVYRMLWLQQNRHMTENQGNTRHGSPTPVLAQGD
ncbi:peptidase domain-containing ABC transporter [Acidisoma cellulosilytica]|uniref:Peptidase domain-containing ABC transporter n=2 Tax=Acidisoma cellulosilyticum TaxID=2802395 RepID=A0A963YZC3_9PROT|nr:peptidase domain-containing ABC transporter [Acidisoma cellulosilyticum]